MSNDEPASGQPPEDDPFRKRPQQPPGDSASGDAPPPGQGPYGSPPPPPGPGAGGAQGDPYGGGSGGGGQWGGGPAGQGGPYGGQGGGPYGQGPYGPGPGPYGQGPYGQGPYGQGPYGDPYGGAPGTGPMPGMPPVAPFGRRLLARIIDWLIVAVPLAIIALGVNGFDFSTSHGQSEADQFGDDFNTGQQWLWSLVSLAVYIAYDTWMTRVFGRTLGKRWLGLRIGMLADGSVPSVSTGVLRAFVLWAPAMLCCFCVWWIVIAITILASRPYKQGWHDKAARTVVVVT